LSLVRLLPAWLHAIADYAVGVSLIVVALVVGGPGKAVAAGVVIGAVVLVVSMLTRYPLGVIKVLPFKVHSAGDYLAVVLLVASPFALGFNHGARGLTTFYIGAGVAVLLVSLITNYQYSPKGQALTATGVRGRAQKDQAWEADNQAAVGPVPSTRPAFDLSYPPQGAPAPSYAPQAGPPSYAPQAGPPSYAPQAGPPSYAPQAAAQPAPGGQSWRTASWQSRALVDLPRTSTPPTTAVEPPATHRAAVEPATADFSPAEADVAPSSAQPVGAARPLRQILAERAANQRSVA
jgi:hypothetical protein